tara:strand:+ start:135 stop:398 length:264 start_codon:yes stop_codon:yes gene_type:complete
MVIGNARNTRDDWTDVMNVTVSPSVDVELTETNVESTVCSHFFPAQSVSIPVYRNLHLICTCAPILVKNPLNVITKLALSEVLKAVD